MPTYQISLKSVWFLSIGCEKITTNNIGYTWRKSQNVTIYTKWLKSVQTVIFIIYYITFTIRLEGIKNEIKILIRSTLKY